MGRLMRISYEEVCYSISRESMHESLICHTGSIESIPNG